jgi:hypothetical protein
VDGKIAAGMEKGVAEHVLESASRSPVLQPQHPVGTGHRNPAREMPARTDIQRRVGANGLCKDPVALLPDQIRPFVVDGLADREHFILDRHFHAGFHLQWPPIPVTDTDFAPRKQTRIERRALVKAKNLGTAASRSMAEIWSK